jgi:hypothetical protein
VLHGNQPSFKRVLSSLQALDGGLTRATCAQCEAALRAESAAAPPGEGYTYMSRVVRACCCDVPSPSAVPHIAPSADVAGAVPPPTGTSSSVVEDARARKRGSAASARAPAASSSGRLPESLLGGRSSVSDDDTDAARARLPESLFGSDVSQPGVLAAVAAAVAGDGHELVVVSADASEVAAPLALNTIKQFAKLGTCWRGSNRRGTAASGLRRRRLR